MKLLTIRGRILVTFFVIFLVLATISSFVYFRAAAIGENSRALKSDAIVGLYQSSLIKDALAADFHRVSMGRPTAAEQSAKDNQAEIGRLINAYEQTIFTNADRASLAKFTNAYAAYENAKGATGGNLRAQYDKAMAAIGDVATLNQKRALALTDEIDGQVHVLLTVITVCFLLAYAVLGVVCFRLLGAIVPPLKQLTALMDTMRQGDFTKRMTIERNDELGDLGEGFNQMADEIMELVGQVQRSGIRVSTSMTEIAATSKQQQATATEVAATTTQIGATSREIAATSKELVRTMSDVASVSEHAAVLASDGQADLAHMEDTMNHVMEAASSINAKLAVLNEKAGAINQVVTTITKVADQTNLLSLNAAIEAEKAGEYGRGFAVVSSEIRRLADQTGVATYDIEQMVKEIQSAVSAAVMGMDKFSEEVRRGLQDVHEIGGKLSSVIAEVQTLAPRFETVSEGMQAQATGAEQISEALVQLTDATQQTVESLRQSSSAIDELNQVSGNLHASIARFRLAAA